MASVSRPAANHPERVQDANRYLNLLRNAPKRRYGFAYLTWLNGGAIGEPPAHPGLSVMGAQAVRLMLDTFRLWEA